jgi:hypothetical protein
MTSEDFYRILLMAYPARYRREYGEAMAQCFRDQLRTADTRGKRIQLWLRTAADFARNVPARHMASEELYRVLLKAYPASYRHEYEEYLAQSFRDQLHSATTWARRARLWFRATRSLVRNAPVRHLRHLWDFTMPRSRPTGDNNRYSEISRALWLARFEAGSSHSGEIRLEHLLLGTLRHDRELATVLLGSHGLETIARSIQTTVAYTTPANETQTTLPEIPLNVECKRALAMAAQEARYSKKINPRHVLSAILHQDMSLAARLFRQNALDLSRLRSDSDPERMKLKLDCDSARKADERPVRFRLWGREYVTKGGAGSVVRTRQCLLHGSRRRRLSVCSPTRNFHSRGGLASGFIPAAAARNLSVEMSPTAFPCELRIPQITDGAALRLM